MSTRPSCSAPKRPPSPLRRLAVALPSMATPRLQGDIEQAVMAAEQRLGRAPKDVSADQEGYDILSHDPKEGIRRFIEVKGRRSDADTLTLTSKEIRQAGNCDDTNLPYILAIVQIDLGAPREPVYIYQPSRLYGAEPGFNEVSRTFKLKDFLIYGEPPR